MRFVLTHATVWTSWHAAQFAFGWTCLRSHAFAQVLSFPKRPALKDHVAMLRAYFALFAAIPGSDKSKKRKRRGPSLILHLSLDDGENDGKNDDFLILEAILEGFEIGVGHPQFNACHAWAAYFVRCVFNFCCSCSLTEADGARHVVSMAKLATKLRLADGSHLDIAC